MSGFRVIQPGMLTLITDGGRYGCHRIGLTTGGPLDPTAFMWANRLCSNEINTTALELTVGGLVLEANTSTSIALTGAEMPLKINGEEVERWQTHPVKAGDRIEVGFSTAGARAYLAVAGGFDIAPQFGSTATVTREKLGGLNGNKLDAEDQLPCTNQSVPTLKLAEAERPNYQALNKQPLRVVLGYQREAFSDIKKRQFFSSDYTISSRADRMGYRLEGTPISPSINGILSEGICLGAIQVPADGQPIVLLNDRQTIGGYPKLGSVISIDTARLAQMMPGTAVQFEEISQEDAQILTLLQRKRFENTALITL